MAAVILALLLGGSPVAASGLVQSGEAARYEAAVTAEARAAFGRYGGAPCPEARVALAPAKPVRIAGRADIRAAVQPTRVTGCGRVSLQPVNVLRGGGDPPWRLASTLPGVSLADPVVQQKALLSVAARARETTGAPCASPTVGDIRIASLPGALWLKSRREPTPRPRARNLVILPMPAAVAARRRSLNLSQAWMELWPLGWCGAVRATAVAFIPRRDGAAPFYMLADVPPPPAGAVTGSAPRSSPPTP